MALSAGDGSTPLHMAGAGEHLEVSLAPLSLTHPAFARSPRPPPSLMPLPPTPSPTHSFAHRAFTITYALPAFPPSPSSLIQPPSHPANQLANPCSRPSRPQPHPHALPQPQRLRGQPAGLIRPPHQARELNTCWRCREASQWACCRPAGRSLRHHRPAEVLQAAQLHP